jgi:hypothetical protein
MRLAASRLQEGAIPMDDEPSNEDAPRGARNFGEFPFSIRVAQRSLLIAIAIPIFLRRGLQAKVPWMRWSVFAASGICAAVGLIATFYAVIRYPYMGLVDAADGDLFAKYIESNRKWVLVTVKVLMLIGALAGIIVPMLDGQISQRDAWVILYAFAILAFMVFLLFFYNREDHPTVATFLRCSMGLGVFFYPLYIPALVIGSMRVQRLLDDAVQELDREQRMR